MKLRQSLAAALIALSACGQPKPERPPSDQSEGTSVDFFERGRQWTSHLMGDVMEGIQEIDTSAKPDFSVSQEEVAEIEALKTQIEQVYGVEILMNSVDKSFLEKMKNEDLRDASDEQRSRLEATVDFESVHPIKPIHQKQVLEYLRNYFSIIAPLVVKNYGPKRIHLVEQPILSEYYFGDFAGLGGDDILLNFSDGKKLDNNVLHELFHSLDQHSEGGWSRDHRSWLRSSHTLPDEPYKDKKRSDDCFDKFGEYENFEMAFRFREGCRELFRRELRGYLHTYGFIWGGDLSTESHVENKATDGSILLTQDHQDESKELGIHWFVIRAHEDPLVRDRLKLLTGCNFELIQDDNGEPSIIFTRLLTLREYQRLTGNRRQEFDYYRAWSTDEEGNVWMDADYYNDLYRGEKIDLNYWNRKKPTRTRR